jgi:hypothetical protein
MQKTSTNESTHVMKHEIMQRGGSPLARLELSTLPFLAILGYCVKCFITHIGHTFDKHMCSMIVTQLIHKFVLTAAFPYC